MRTFVVLLLLLHGTLSFADTPLPPALAEWMTYEQSYIDRTVDTRRIMAPDVKNQQEEYRPESRKWFDLPSIWVPGDVLDTAQIEQLVSTDLYKELVKTVDGKKLYRLFIHPESQKFYADLIAKYGPPATDYTATATSSSRSLVVHPKNNPNLLFFAKVSLGVELGNVDRTIPAAEVARSVGLTRYIEFHKPELSRTFENIPEVFGIAPKGWRRGGQIIRLIPNEVLQNKSILVPLFALYAPNPTGTPLLVELARRENMTPNDYLQKFVVDPFVDAWVDWSVKGSIIMEPHAQNVLFELNADHRPTGRLFLRDGGGYYVNRESPLLKNKNHEGLPLFHDLKIDYDWFAEDTENHSLNTYFAGGFLFNIDKLFASIDPKYKKGDAYDHFWNRVAVKMKEQGHLKSGQVTTSALQKDMKGVLKAARANYAKSPRPLKIGIYSGTFDPPHLGHESVIRRAMLQIGLDVVYVVPNPDPKHKPGANNYKVRHDMAELAFGNIPGVKVVSGNLERDIRSAGSVEKVIERIERNHPGAIFYNILGDDNVKKHHEALEHTPLNINFVVSDRDAESGIGIGDTLGKAPLIQLPNDGLVISSTSIREQMKYGFEPKELSPAVVRYIKSHGLYGNDQPAKGRKCGALVDLITGKVSGF